jgi:uncharacterized membrane protein
MRGEWLYCLVFFAAIGSAVVGGVFYAFSTFVMKALRRLPAQEGVAAMQSINVAVINPMFLGLFLGTAAVCAGVVVAGVARWGERGTGYLLAGAALNLVGTFGVTVACNVPLNNRLAGVRPTGSEAVQEWERYVKRWTVWNHVRTVAGVVAAALLVIALSVG